MWCCALRKKSWQRQNYKELARGKGSDRANRRGLSPIIYFLSRSGMHVGRWLILQVVWKWGDQDEEQHWAMTRRDTAFQKLSGSSWSTYIISTYIWAFGTVQAIPEVYLCHVWAWTRLTVSSKTTGNQTSQLRSFIWNQCLSSRWWRSKLCFC